MTAEQATLLSEFNFVIAVDASGSMGETDMPGGRSRWDYMQESLTAFARDMATIDSNGLDLVVFGGSNVQTFTGVDAAKVKDAFTQRSPRGSTPLAEALTACLAVVGKSDKKAVVVVFTDGVPDDRQAAARVITQAANKLETDDQLNFLFVQVGHDRSATAYLKSLDDDLRGVKFDIVDAKTMDEAEAFATTVDLICSAIKD